MEFTYESYANMVHILQEHDYRIISYSDAIHAKDSMKWVILRHDIDMCIGDALRFSEIEKDLGVSSTYFVILKTDMYNPVSLGSLRMLNEIIENGHDIGLHFDELQYPPGTDLVEKIKEECDILGRLLGREINVVSMHRPSKTTLESDYKIDGILNSYGSMFFDEYKYLSDSRMRWREDALGIIESEEYSRLHILTHPVWYKEEDASLRDRVIGDLKRRKIASWNTWNENLADFEELVGKDEIDSI